MYYPLAPIYWSDKKSFSLLSFYPLSVITEEGFSIVIVQRVVCILLDFILVFTIMILLWFFIEIRLNN